jgi:magnesium transporter
MQHPEQIIETAFPGFTWTHIIHPNLENMERFAEKYSLNDYQLTDSLQPGHLPKYEQQHEYRFLILRALLPKLPERNNTVGQMSGKVAFFYNGEKVITICRHHLAILEKPFSEDINSPEEFVIVAMSRIFQTYEGTLKQLSDKVDNIEKIIFLRNFSRISLEDLYFHKSKTRVIKKLLQISQSVLNQIKFQDIHQTAFQDVKDQLFGLILGYEETMENSINLLNTYLSINSRKTNDVMKLLTIFSVFFLPLTFIVGVYGMNFKNMPELYWQNGYYYALTLMAFVCIAIFIWFRKRKII